MLDVFLTGLLLDDDIIKTLTGQVVQDKEKAILEGYDLVVQRLDQIPEPAKGIIKESWGRDFKSYNLTSGKGSVRGIKCKVTSDQWARLNDWELEQFGWFVQKEIIIKNLQTGQNESVKTMIMGNDQKFDHKVNRENFPHFLMPKEKTLKVALKSRQLYNDRNSMRKIVVTEFLSLDGVFEAPGPDGAGFKYEGWTFDYFSDEFLKFKSAELESADAQLLGRVTYDGFAKAWSERKGDSFSDKFNAMPKYVVSKSLKKTGWNNSHIISGDIVEEVKKLDGELLIAGSGQLVRFLLDNNLVDQLNLLVYPVVLGEGKKLFEGAQIHKLELIKSEQFSSGIMALVYQPVTK